MKVVNFRGLKVWELAHSLVLDIYKATKNYPKDETYGLVSQLRRSAVSICANMAEGYKKSRKEFSRFLDIAEGSLEETKYHLILSRDLDYLASQEYESLHKKSEEVGRMLNGLKQKLQY